MSLDPLSGLFHVSSYSPALLKVCENRRGARGPAIAIVGGKVVNELDRHETGNVQHYHERISKRRNILI